MKHVQRETNLDGLFSRKEDSMFSLLLGAIATGASVGGVIGSAFAMLTGTSVATGTAVGTLAGAGLGLVAGIEDVAEA